MNEEQEERGLRIIIANLESFDQLDDGASEQLRECKARLKELEGVGIMKNKYSLYARVNERWMHVFSYLTKREAEENRQFYCTHHGNMTLVIPINR